MIILQRFSSFFDTIIIAQSSRRVGPEQRRWDFRKPNFERATDGPRLGGYTRHRRIPASPREHLVKVIEGAAQFRYRVNPYVPRRRGRYYYRRTIITPISPQQHVSFGHYFRGEFNFLRNTDTWVGNTIIICRGGILFNSTNPRFRRSRWMDIWIGTYTSEETAESLHGRPTYQFCEIIINDPSTMITIFTTMVPSVEITRGRKAHKHTTHRGSHSCPGGQKSGKKTRWR